MILLNEKPEISNRKPAAPIGEKREGTLRHRVVCPEWLDQFDPSETCAIRARRDLRRINAWMRNATLVSYALKSLPPPRCIVDLGAGDGTFLLQVARRLAAQWPNVEAVLVDRLKLLAPETRDDFQKIGWTARDVQADVLDWLFEDHATNAEVLVSNLFLHHFPAPQLQNLLQACARRARWFLACEPRRSHFSLSAAECVGLIGCNEVTKHDAAISVRAGFRAQELSRAWPQEPEWRLCERPAGLFSHLFTAGRRDQVNSHG